mmetsp:Transcript_54814/g.146314  ORF Transcript_54814/g.146314 Transcript_54814/m.146314 type:complete len:205 (-) Transcript_54814:39-653(-)
MSRESDGQAKSTLRKTWKNPTERKKVDNVAMEPNMNGMVPLYSRAVKNEKLVIMKEVTAALQMPKRRNLQEDRTLTAPTREPAQTTSANVRRRFPGHFLQVPLEQVIKVSTDKVVAAMNQMSHMLAVIQAFVTNSHGSAHKNTRKICSETKRTTRRAKLARKTSGVSLANQRLRARGSISPVSSLHLLTELDEADSCMGLRSNS